MALPDPSTEHTVVVTGASAGIGTELARELASRGHGLTLVARRRDRLEELAEELEVPVAVEPCDLADPEERTRLIGALGRGRPIAGVCNNAGYGTVGRFADLPLDREVGEVRLNVEALVELTGAFLPQMTDRGAGAILNVASTASYQPLPNMAVYAATKAFVRSFSEATHTELGGTGVSVTTLCPGFTETEFAGTVRHADGQHLEVELDDGERAPAWHDPALIGPCHAGDEVVVNVQARRLELGSGGFDIVHCNLTRGLRGTPTAPDAHVMKLNYT